MTRRFLPGFIIALGLLALGLLVAFTVGRYPVTPADLIEVLVSRLAGQAAAVPPSGAVEGDIFYRTLSIDENSVISARRL